MLYIIKKYIKNSLPTLGLVTTPQLHYLVVTANDPTYGESSLDGYYNKLSGAFKTLEKFKEVSLFPF